MKDVYSRVDRLINTLTEMCATLDHVVSTIKRVAFKPKRRSLLSDAVKDDRTNLLSAIYTFKQSIDKKTIALSNNMTAYIFTTDTRFSYGFNVNIRSDALPASCNPFKRFKFLYCNHAWYIYCYFYKKKREYIKGKLTWTTPTTTQSALQPLRYEDTFHIRTFADISSLLFHFSKNYPFCDAFADVNIA
jgi:hypothetical protein